MGACISFPVAVESLEDMPTRSWSNYQVHCLLDRDVCEIKRQCKEVGSLFTIKTTPQPQSNMVLSSQACPLQNGVRDVVNYHPTACDDYFAGCEDF